METFQTPILLITFNRPDTTLKVLEAIKQVKPKTLYVSSDGPRHNNQNDKIGVEAVRVLIDQFVDWDCEVIKLYREKNLGCKLGVSSAISWFFDNVEEGIILEDDCLPVTTFFRFCEELLQRYRQTTEVMMISGDYFSLPESTSPESYYFTKHFHIWGWATWRRAWNKYDITMSEWPNLESQFKKNLNFDSRIWKTYKTSFTRVFEGRLNTWDYQWTYSSWKNDGLAICPTRNLISNIGFGANATHTMNTESILSEMPTEEMNFPLIHPEKVERNIMIEQRCEKISFPTLLTRIKDKLLMLIKRT